MAASIIIMSDGWAGASLAVGAVTGLWPVAVRIRHSCPSDFASLRRLLAQGAKYFYGWLAFMVYYLLSGAAFGYPLFEVVTTVVVSAMFFRRAILPGIAGARWYWQHESEARAA